VVHPTDADMKNFALARTDDPAEAELQGNIVPEHQKYISNARSAKSSKQSSCISCLRITNLVDKLESSK